MAFLKKKNDINCNTNVVMVIYVIGLDVLKKICEILLKDKGNVLHIT